MDDGVDIIDLGSDDGATIRTAGVRYPDLAPTIRQARSAQRDNGDTSSQGNKRKSSMAALDDYSEDDFEVEQAVRMYKRNKSNADVLDGFQPENHNGKPADAKLRGREWTTDHMPKAHQQQSRRSQSSTSKVKREASVARRDRYVPLAFQPPRGIESSDRSTSPNPATPVRDPAWNKDGRQGMDFGRSILNTRCTSISSTTLTPDSSSLSTTSRNPRQSATKQDATRPRPGSGSEGRMDLTSHIESEMPLYNYDAHLQQFRKDLQKRKLRERKAAKGHISASREPEQPPHLPQRFANPPQDLDQLIATLNEVPAIIENVNNQWAQLFHDLGTKVQTHDEDVSALKAENARLWARIDDAAKEVVDSTNRRLDGVEESFTEKMDEVIHSNDEVVAQQDPVAGGAYGGPRHVQPGRAQSVFHGLMRKSP